MVLDHLDQQVLRELRVLMDSREMLVQQVPQDHLDQKETVEQVVLLD